MIDHKYLHVLYLALALTCILSCGRSESTSYLTSFQYDLEIPLYDSLQQDDVDQQLYYLTYRSVHDAKVTGIMTLPEKGEPPYPVVILMHGLGDSKTVDYIEAGNQLMTEAGYAVLRLDICNHGDRHRYDYDFSLINGFRYWTRDLITQTVFDLRRAVDFIENAANLDQERIGYMGISLGGIIGTIFCGVEERVKVPVIILAGGNLNLMFGLDAFSNDTRDFLSLVDPINFVEAIAPRPLLMINADNDDVIPPVTSKLLYKRARDPKKIIWYPAKHHDVPVNDVYQDGINWMNIHL